MRKFSKTIAILLPILLVFFVFYSCSYKKIKHGQEITEDQLLKIENGKTTKSQILMDFGEPTKSMNDEKVFFYSWTRGSKASFMGLGGGEAYSHSLVVVFDNNGVVTNHRITRGATDSGATVGD